MHIYNVGYTSYEESAGAQLWHEKKFSQEDFEGMIARIVAEEFKDCKEADKITFQDVFFEVVQGLVKDFGFKEVEFDASFCPFGWANILDEKSWERDRGEELDRLAKAIKANRK